MTDKIQLNDGNFLPSLGFGTYQLQGDSGKKNILIAIQNGIRLIDTASRYDNEEIVGQAMKESEVSRKDLFLTTKLWRDTLSYDGAIKAFHQSLKKLQTDYIDLYLIHWPANAKNYTDWQKANAEAWRALEDLKEEGKIKSIGVSNFWQEHLEALFQTAHSTPSVNQIEFHPGYWQPELHSFNKQNNIITQAWSPYGRGAVFQNATLIQIAQKYNKSVAQIVLRWIIHHGAIPIPKSSSLDRVKESLEIRDFSLTSEEMKTINNLDTFGFSGELPNEWPERV